MNKIICNNQFLLRVIKYALSKNRTVFESYNVGNVFAQRMCSSAGPDGAIQIEPNEENENNLIEFHGTWPEQEKLNFIKDMRIIPNFLSEDEENKIFLEIDPHMSRLRYEYDHWDDAIHGYRETERKHWFPHNREILDRVQEMAFEDAVMPYVHVLDLAGKGVIKPHVDSTRYCGSTIAGISLLSDAVMRLVRTDERKYLQKPDAVDDGNTEVSASANETYRDQPKTTLENNFYADLLLQRRSLYIMSHTARYNFTHEILADEKSKFRAKLVKKERRISIICRNEPRGSI